MRKTMAAVAFAVVVALLVPAAPVEASGGACAAPLCAFVDAPAGAGGTVKTADFKFSGWTLNTTTGLPTGNVLIWRTDLNGANGQVVPFTLTRTARPDVQTAFGCGVPLYTGYQMTPVAQAPGDYIYSILFTDAPYSMQSVGVVEHVIVQ